MFHDGLKGFHKIFWGTTMKFDHKNLSQFLFYYNFLKCTGLEGLMGLSIPKMDQVKYVDD